MKKLSEIKENVLFRNCGQVRINDAIRLLNELHNGIKYAGKQGLFYGIVNGNVFCENIAGLKYKFKNIKIKHISVDQFISLVTGHEPEPTNLEVIYMIYNKEVARTDFENLKDYHKFLRENEGGIVIIQKKESEFEKFNKILNKLSLQLIDSERKELYNELKQLFNK